MLYGMPLIDKITGAFGTYVQSTIVYNNYKISIT